MAVSIRDWKSLLEFKVQTEYLLNVFLHKKAYCILRRNGLKNMQWNIFHK